MEGQPITTNPVLIMLINMTIVFGVLGSLGVVIEIIHRLDPTKKKSEPAAPAPVVQAASAPAPVAAAPVVDTAAQEMEEKTLRAVITTAIMASGHKDFEILSIRKVD